MFVYDSSSQLLNAMIWCLAFTKLKLNTYENLIYFHFNVFLFQAMYASFDYFQKFKTRNNKKKNDNKSMNSEFNANVALSCTLNFCSMLFLLLIAVLIAPIENRVSIRWWWSTMCIFVCFFCWFLLLCIHCKWLYMKIVIIALETN